MAARKPMMGPKPERGELDGKIRNALARPMTDAEYAEQRASFAYGNAPESDYITKASTMKSNSSFRLRSIAA